jgi:cell division septum initiation protein DivIVA
MEDAVIPPRPSFNLQARGFSRTQVNEHVELLEDRLRLLARERDEAVQLNADRNQQADTGHIRWEDERDQARRQAEVIVDRAEAEARELISDAESLVNELRAEADELAGALEKRHDKLRREHAKKVDDLRAREKRLRHTIRREYKNLIANAQDEADELIAYSRLLCQQEDNQAEERRLDALEEIKREREALDGLRRETQFALDNAAACISTYTASLGTVHIPVLDDDQMTLSSPSPIPLTVDLHGDTPHQANATADLGSEGNNGRSS